jgi:hypothetical protein
MGSNTIEYTVNISLGKLGKDGLTTGPITYSRSFVVYNVQKLEIMLTNKGNIVDSTSKEDLRELQRNIHEMHAYIMHLITTCTDLVNIREISTMVAAANDNIKHETTQQNIGLTNVSFPGSRFHLFDDYRYADSSVVEYRASPAYKHSAVTTTCYKLKLRSHEMNTNIWPKMCFEYLDEFACERCMRIKNPSKYADVTIRTTKHGHAHGVYWKFPVECNPKIDHFNQVLPAKFKVQSPATAFTQADCSEFARILHLHVTSEEDLVFSQVTSWCVFFGLKGNDKTDAQQKFKYVAVLFLDWVYTHNGIDTVYLPPH